MATLKLPFTARRYISEHVDEQGETCTVVLRNTVPVPAEVTYAGGAYEAHGQPVLVVPGALAKTLRGALQAESMGTTKGGSRLRRVKLLLNTEDDALAGAVAAFLKRSRAKRRPAVRVASCIRVLKRIATGVLASCLAAILFVLGVFFTRPSSEEQRSLLGSASAAAVDFGPILACVLAMLQSMNMSASCAEVCTLLLVFAMVNASLFNATTLSASGAPGMFLLATKVVALTAGSALTVSLLLVAERATRG